MSEKRLNFLRSAVEKDPNAEMPRYGLAMELMGLDEFEESDGKKKKYSFTRTSRLKPLARDQGSYDGGSFRPREKAPQTHISKRITGSRSRIQFPLEARQKQLRENLLAR